MLKEIAENGQVVKKLKEVLADGNVQGGICALIKSYRKPLGVFEVVTGGSD